LATSSSGDRGRRVSAALITAGAVAAITAVALLVLGLYADVVDWPLAVIILFACGAVLGVLAAYLAPRFRRLAEATVVADALAAGRFDARAEVHDDEFGGLATALNAAGQRLDELVRSLRQDRAQLEALLNASSDATVAVDDAARIVYMNDAARNLFLATDAMGRPFIEVVRDHDLTEIMAAAARSGERSVRVVVYGPAQRWIQATAVPIAGGGAWAALAVFHDLTEVRRLEGVRRDFISNVSHELRTPLAGIRAAAETLQEGAIDDRPAALEFLGHIQRETDRMTQMVEELLELSRIESGAAPLHFAQMDAAALVRDTARRFGQQAERAGLSLRADVGETPLSIIGDAERLERAIGNLVANAIKFTPAGGTVNMSARAAEGGVEIAVSDTGPGIEPEEQSRVFERFYKTDRGRGSGGTGLGLAIVKHIVQAHEGTVALESRPGRGSKFTILLPAR
jgi:two-component system phosphate regulon sensor histidine kinase PhoR